MMEALHRTLFTRSALRGRTPSALGLAPFVDLSENLVEARRNRRPLIALESTILTHGLPPAAAIQVAQELEQIATDHHVTPVHIAVINGRIKLGLSPHDLHHLIHSQPNHHHLHKIGRRDLPTAITQKIPGGTTVSATMAIAHLAGIKVFATGGIGGVHRGASHTMDISSDLTELSKTPVAVVCAGVKSILDIPLTLEYLETLGVPVISFSKTKEFPAFYSPQSGHQAPFNSTSTLECAQMIYHSDLLEYKSGTLVAVPIPREYTQSGQVIQDAVERAVLESEKLGLNTAGKAVTPWLLNRVKDLTGGKSVDANIGLIKNNVIVASQIAHDYNNIVLASEPPSSAMIPESTMGAAKAKADGVQSDEGRCRMMVIGAAAIDITSRMPPDDPTNPLSTRSTSPGSVRMSAGGVALNIARGSHGLGVQDVMLVSQVGTQCSFGEHLLTQLGSIGLRSDGIHLNHRASTGMVNMFLDRNGELLGGVADLKSVEKMDYQLVSNLIRNRKPKVVCFDGNLSADGIYELLQTCHESDSMITAFEPTSVAKSIRIMRSLVGTYERTKGRKRVTMMFPNLHELQEMHEKGLLNSNLEALESVEYFQSLQALQADETFTERVRKTSPAWVAQSGTLQMALKLLPFVQLLVVKNGAHGVVLVANKSESSTCNLFPSASHLESQQPQDGAHHYPWIFNRSKTLCFKFFPPVAIGSMNPIEANSQGETSTEPVVNVTGAGDSLCASILSAVTLHCDDDGAHLRSFDWDKVIHSAQSLAVRTLLTNNSTAN